MIDTNDHQINDQFPVKRGRGRPVTGKAKTDAERARAYRLRKKQCQAIVSGGNDAPDSFTDRLDELEKMVADLTAERNQLKNQVVDLQSKIFVGEVVSKTNFEAAIDRLSQCQHQRDLAVKVLQQSQRAALDYLDTCMIPHAVRSRISHIFAEANAAYNDSLFDAS